MVTPQAKAEILKKRAAALNPGPDAVARVVDIAAICGLRMSDAGERLRVEWLNDVLAAPDPRVYRKAKADPGEHFVEWARERCLDPFHVSYRSINKVDLLLGATFAARMTVIWKQEVAWAQRMRLYGNPRLATKAALFLREVENTPGKVFEKLADLHADAYSKPGYADHQAHGLSDTDIRFGKLVPDYTPMFLRYADRAYSDKLAALSRENFEALSVRAAKDEQLDRRRSASRRAAAAAERSPMRRSVNVVAKVLKAGWDSNGLVLEETRFLSMLNSGERLVEPETILPIAEFLEHLAECSPRSGEMPEDETDLAWSVVRLKPRWLETLPTSYKGLGTKMRVVFEKWQSDIAEGHRIAPMDPVCDFAFALLAGKKS